MQKHLNFKQGKRKIYVYIINKIVKSKKTCLFYQDLIFFFIFSQNLWFLGESVTLQYLKLKYLLILFFHFAKLLEFNIHQNEYRK